MISIGRKPLMVSWIERLAGKTLTP